MNNTPVRNIIHGLGGPRKIAERILAEGYDNPPTENAVTQWGKRDLIPYRWRHYMKVMCIACDYSLSDDELKRLSTDP